MHVKDFPISIGENKCPIDWSNGSCFELKNKNLLEGQLTRGKRIFQTPQTLISMLFISKCAWQRNWNNYSPCLKRLCNPPLSKIVWHMLKDRKEIWEHSLLRNLITRMSLLLTKRTICNNCITVQPLDISMHCLYKKFKLQYIDGK